MDFSSIKAITIPEGNVTQIEAGGRVIWEKGDWTTVYQEVNYIMASANVGAYLDLGFSFDTSATVYMTQWLGGEVETAYPFGASENSGKLRCLATNPYNSVYGGQLYGSSGTAYVQTSIYGNDGKNEFVFTFKKGCLRSECVTNGRVYEITTQGEYTMTNHLYLFAQNYNGTPRFGGKRRLGKFQYYDKNNNLICDLIPCYRKADGIIGMYDIVRKIFLTNAGTGTFTKGTDV